VTGLGRAALLAAAPVLLAQGRQVRRTTPRLAEAAGTSSDAGPPLVVVVGDSVAAGVGVDHHEHTVAGRLASLLSAERGGPVGWRVVARSGATAGEVAALLAARRRDVDAAEVVVVSVGVNDTLRLHADARWRHELGGLLDDVSAAAPGADVVLLGVPPMGEFPALPTPLRQLLAGRARRLDALGGSVVAERAGVRHLPLTLAVDATSFAADGFHPSAASHALLAEQVAVVRAGPARAGGA
jgi:lysophospholipase L1-like esterase